MIQKFTEHSGNYWENKKKKNPGKPSLYLLVYIIKFKNQRKISTKYLE